MLKSSSPVLTRALIVFSPSRTQTPSLKLEHILSKVKHEEKLTWIEVLLVWLILSIRVANLRHDVILLAEDVVSDTGEVCVLQVSIKIDLDNTIADGLLELLLGRTRSTVED